VESPQRAALKVWILVRGPTIADSLKSPEGNAFGQLHRGPTVPIPVALSSFEAIGALGQ
jgi:hypothetical protein